MGEKYEPIRANAYFKNETKIGTEGNVYFRPSEDGEVRVTEESQLDRLEKKLDRILELLEGQELSTSFELLTKEINERYEADLRKHNML